jgi:hypothetical protein
MSSTSAFSHSILRGFSSIAWLDLAPDALVATCDGVANRAVLVRSGHLVRMGLLSMHGLALAGLARLGHQDPPSYIQLMIRELFGIDLGPNRANALALGTLTAAAVISILLNVRDRRRSNQLRA